MPMTSLSKRDDYIAWSPLVGILTYPAPVIVFAVISDHDGALNASESACLWGYGLWLAAWLWFDLRRYAAWKRARASEAK
jgi:hypothetical protein